jgi:hypothetical protein
MLERLNTEIYWHFCGLLLIMFLATFNQKTKKKGIVIMTAMSLPGVILHEAMHALAGCLFFAKIERFSIIPKYNGDGYWTMGSVFFSRLNAFNAVPVGLAPLTLVVVALVVYIHWTAFFTPNFLSVLGLYFTVFILIYESLPSRQDIKMAFNIKSILLYGVVGYLVFLLLKRM